MQGYRAGGWACFAAAVISFLIALVRLKGMGIVEGQRQEESSSRVGEIIDIRGESKITVGDVESERGVDDAAVC